MVASYVYTLKMLRSINLATLGRNILSKKRLGVQIHISFIRFNANSVQKSNILAKERFYGHHSDVLNKRINKPVPKHFCDGRHKVSDMLFIPFEKLRKKDQTLLDLREKFWINKKNTAKTGLNIRY